MAQVVIENPVINSPFAEPSRHFRFDDDGITDEVAEERRVSSYFIPVARTKKKGKQEILPGGEWTQDRVKENDFINQVRGRVTLWRQRGYPDITNVTRRLLAYWKDAGREKPLFFCQIEALETTIYLTEAAGRQGDTWIGNDIREKNRNANPDLYRIALKMATGSGKTVVMAMLIAWQALNKLAYPQDNRFSDAFLLVTPGITIRDRLRVLLPQDAGNYYRARDVVSEEDLAQLGVAKIVITNFHAFLRREKTAAGKLTKAMLRGGSGRTGVSALPGDSAFTESPGEMVRRVCRELGNKKNVVVINDEAHHCYRRRAADTEEEKLVGDERKEAAKREEEARVWISGLEAVKRKLGIRALYDLSATPFFLRGSGYSEGTLFPWVVSDFSLIDAIECGIVKVPRVPVEDDAMTGDLPTFRDLWSRIKDDLPKKGRGTDAVSGEPKLPAVLEAALESLYRNYEKSFAQWRAAVPGGHKENDGPRGRGPSTDGYETINANAATPPVFIVVCNNTNVSKLVFDHIAGWEKPLPDGTTCVVPGKLELFSNEENGGWSARPNTILVDSEQLESGEAMSADFKKIAVREIEEFKAECRLRFPGRDVEELTDEDLLREVMNTVGKPGKLGEGVRCVVSVSMLTEGWDANTVTHILGVRAFGTQLLCEQVVGRGLRRTNYEPNADGMYEPEYAEVYGVPFSFIPCSGSKKDPPPPVPVTHVRALPERIALEITFPRLLGYRYALPSERLTAHFTEDSRLTLSTQDVPTITETRPIVGESSIHTLDELAARRVQEVDFKLAKLVLEKYFRADGTQKSAVESTHRYDGEVQAWLFPQVLSIARRWREEHVHCKDGVFPQLLLLVELAHRAADRIYRAIVAGESGEKRLLPVLRPYDSVGSTRYVDFDTRRATYLTSPERCHVSHVVLDSDWEAKMAQILESLKGVHAYVKNDRNLGFTIPYTSTGEEKQYVPDYLVRLDDGHGPDDLLTLILEVTGEKRPDKTEKVATARTLWVPAVNNDGGFGRWAFVEIEDPWEAEGEINGVRNHR